MWNTKITIPSYLSPDIRSFVNVAFTYPFYQIFFYVSKASRLVSPIGIPLFVSLLWYGGPAVLLALRRSVQLSFRRSFHVSRNFRPFGTRVRILQHRPSKLATVQYFSNLILTIAISETVRDREPVKWANWVFELWSKTFLMTAKLDFYLKSYIFFVLM